MIGADGTVLGGIGGQCPGHQTVNRGELYAVTWAAERVQAPPLKHPGPKSKKPCSPRVARGTPVW